MAEVEEVTRILSSSTHFQVLKLHPPGDSPVFVDVQQVRRRYKELAVRVHPDKNRATDAEASFKRLSEAYECLVDEISQRNYLQQIKVQQPNTGPKKAPPKHKHTRKRKAQREPKSDQSDQLPKRRRTPEEIWKAFQREEEELARQQFHAKGFDRVYDSTSNRDNCAGDKPASPLAEPSEKQHEILNSNLDVKAKKWATWSNSTATSDLPPTDTVVPAASDESATLICCLLCRRKFQTVEALSRHETLSKLHSANLKAKQSSDSP